MTPALFPSSTPPAGPARRTCAYLHLCGLAPAHAGEFAARPVDEIQGQLDEWAAGLVPARPDESPEQQRARARAQLLLARAPARWPGHFLAAPAPPELTAAVQGVILEARRPLRQATMTPEPIDLGPVSDVADGTWKTFDKWPVLGGLTVWLLFSLLLAMIFYVVRF